MIANELNKKFLTVGHQRRKNIGGDLTPKYKRQVMGKLVRIYAYLLQT
jgi:hypothetical protein